MLLINQLSKRTGLPIHTIRYYEKYGLFAGKKNGNGSTNNYTYYDKEAEEKIQLIREAKEIGFTLREIKALVDAWYSKRLSTERKKDILKKKIQDINKKIKDLKEMKKLVLECMEDIGNNQA